MSARAASAPGAGVLDRLQVLRSAPTPLRGAPAATWTPSPRTGVGPLRVPGPGLQPSSHDTTTTRTDPAGSTLARPDFGPKDGVHLTATRLKLRMAAHDGALIKLLDKGTEVQVLAEEDGWLQVRVDGQEGFASADFITQDEIAKGVVRESSVSVRRAPDDGAQIIGNLSNDSEVRILAEQGDWLRIRFDDDDGYVDASEIERRPEVRQGHVTASSLNLRDAPNGARIGSLARGTEVTILATEGTWLEVDADGLSGWVSADFIEEQDEQAPDEEVSAPGDAGNIRIEGRDVLGPDGTRFAKTFKLGVFSYGTISIEDYVRSRPAGIAGLSNSKLSVMQAVSTNEGKLDAINTWDSAFLTFGCFQWTVGTGAGAGELVALLDRLQKTNGQAFEELFGQFGLGIDSVRAVASEPPRGFLSLHGKALKTAAKKKTLRTVEWAYRFKLAGQNDIMQSIEMAHAADRVDLFYASDRKQIRSRPIADYVSSEYGVALLLDQHVNRPGHVPKVLAQAVAAFVDERGGNDEPSLWSADDEARLLEIYIRLRNATSMTDAQARADRTRKAADLGLASDRRGSYEA